MATGARLKNKVAVVTGAGEAFGRAIAVGYAREGASLFLHEFPDCEPQLRKTEASVKETGQRVVTGLHDITTAGPVEAMTRQIVREFGHVDILVNTTAGGWHGLFFDAKEEDWDRAIDRGLKAYFLTCQHIGKLMAQRGEGRIINLSSIVADLGSAGAIPWGAARGGVNAMSFAIAQCLGEYGINVTVLTRGASDHTDYTPEARATRLMRLPRGRLGGAEDVVGPAIFLATSDSDWVTGSVLYADGGYVRAAATDAEHRAKKVPYPKI